MNLTNKVSLLAGVIALVGAVYMPQANADLKQSVQIDTDTPTSFSGNSLFLDGSLVDQDSVSIVVKDLPGGLHTYDALFMVGGGVNSFSATANFIKPTIKVVTTTLIGTDVASGWDGIQYTFLGLNSGVTHTRETTANITAAKTGGFQTQFTLVTPMPEPEEWAMMLVGVGLVSYQVRRKQKGLSRTYLG